MNGTSHNGPAYPWLPSSCFPLQQPTLQESWRWSKWVKFDMFQFHLSIWVYGWWAISQTQTFFWATQQCTPAEMIIDYFRSITGQLAIKVFLAFYSFYSTFVNKAQNTCKGYQAQLRMTLLMEKRDKYIAHIHACSYLHSCLHSSLYRNCFAIIERLLHRQILQDTMVTRWFPSCAATRILTWVLSKHSFSSRSNGTEVNRFLTNRNQQCSRLLELYRSQEL